MRLSAKTAAFAVILGGVMSTHVFADNTVNITVTPSDGHKAVSPYIYGVNSGVDLSAVCAKSFRLGGNRLSAYNWENNMSNAGSDWHNSSDMYLVDSISEEFKNAPAGAMLNAANEARKGNVPYTLITLQMLGYTSSSKTGQVNEENAAPSDYWFKVSNRKDGEFSLEPDLTDQTVYMDELLNYLITNLGKSDTETGIKAYALDNEPSLWQHTHSLVQREPLSCAELIGKSVDLASVVKETDGGAEVFGPALFGYSAYDSFAGAPDWTELKQENDYRWFIDYYLDEMHKAETAGGKRLLDVLDLHYYTEAKGACGERMCSHYDNDECIKARLDSVRSLYDPDYREKSWIMDTGAKFFPLLPNIQQSIEQYYPDTKTAFTEYNFGGGDHISGGVLEADVLGTFAEYGVYFASIWSFDKNEYQLGAINMFTNYDGMGNGFGNTLVKSEYGGDVSVYSSIDGEDENTVKIIVTNRSIHDDTPVNITLSSDNAYESAEVYSLYGDSPLVRKLDGVGEINGNEFTYTLPALSVTEFVVSAPRKPEVSESVSQAETTVSTGAAGSNVSSVNTENTGNNALPLAIGGVAAVGVAVAVTAVIRNKKKQ